MSQLPLDYFDIDLNDTVIFALKWKDKETTFADVFGKIILKSVSSGKFKEFIEDFLVIFDLENGVPFSYFYDVDCDGIKKNIQLKMEWTSKSIPF